ncbi:hypothetical protein GIB67_002968 [Kingdonia uniflora]|uniref:DUF7895 domain-containing protein n=1 Tax=Kingdonia uniflora TaxID=39325 RepID=A0A7J7M8R6_9MAGN|nr:hypothetical protein GIB67_002968 [Kingdonia uniflora]
MELPQFASFSKATRDCRPEVHIKIGSKSSSPFLSTSKEQRRKISTVSSALAETAASILVAATVVGAAATLLARNKEASEKTDIENPSKPCEDCGGSGICAECKGEGFVVKRLSDERAQKARLSAKNAATRYTAGLPKKWSYCTKCSSARNCSTCGGSGLLSL